MVEHPEWMEDPKLFLDRTALAPTIEGWIAAHTVEEVLDLASAFRIPNAPIANGSNVTTFEHFRERETFVDNPAGWRSEPTTTLPARGRTPASSRSGPCGSESTPLKRSSHAGPPLAAARLRRLGFHSQGCGSWT